MTRESMVFYSSFLDAIEDLPPEEFKKAAMAILLYGIRGEEPSEGGIAKVVYSMAKPQIDANNRRYENGKKGGRPVSEEPNDNQTETKPNQTETKPNQTITKPNQTEPNPENPKPNVNVNVNALKEKTTYVVQKKPTLDEVTEYCRSRGNKVDPQRFIDYYESNGWKVGKNPMKDWKAAVRNWERSSSPPTNKSSPQKGNWFHNFDQRDTDYNEILKEIT